MGDSLVKHAQVTHSGRGHSRVPCDLVLDLRVSDSALRAYLILAAPLRYSNVAYIGQRHLGHLMGISQRTAGRRLKELADLGYIEKSREDGRGKRAHWVLKSAVFSAHQGAADVVVSSPSGGRRLAALDHERHRLPPLEETA